MKEQFDIKNYNQLQHAVIDSSSLIYMQKSRFLDIVAMHIEFHAPKAVLIETGFYELQLIDHANTDVIADTVDQQVVLLGRELQIPIISDDKKVLRKADQLLLPYYNSLMVLNFLLYKDYVTYNQFNNFQQELLKIARYGEQIVSYGRLVTEQILLCKNWDK